MVVSILKIRKQESYLGNLIMLFISNHILKCFCLIITRLIFNQDYTTYF